VKAEGPRPIRAGHEAELGRLPPLPPGTVVELLRPDGEVWRYYGLGSTRPEIAARLRWTQGNVWLRDLERRHILTTRSGLSDQLEEAIGSTLRQAQSVHENVRPPGGWYFLVSGASLLQAGLINSRRVRYLDLVVEERSVEGGSYLRVVHFSPTTRNAGGRQLWP
jgi:hypothetical protein